MTSTHEMPRGSDFTRKGEGHPEHQHGWIVDTTSRRVVRKTCLACSAEAAEVAELERIAASRGLERADTMKVLKQIEEAIEEATEVLDPAQSDLRVVEPEEIHQPPPVHIHHDRGHVPAGTEVRPSPKTVNREHRGF